jgi:hypothetical protein
MTAGMLNQWFACSQRRKLRLAGGFMAPPAQAKCGIFLEQSAECQAERCYKSVILPFPQAYPRLPQGALIAWREGSEEAGGEHEPEGALGSGLQRPLDTPSCERRSAAIFALRRDNPLSTSRPPHL